jgi:hypothetical protein
MLPAMNTGAAAANAGVNPQQAKQAGNRPANGGALAAGR